MPDSLARPFLAEQNVVLSSTNPDIIYNPPLCTPAATLAGCTSPWQANDSIPGSTIVYTDGPIPQAGDVVPQMFLNFRASTLYLRTSSLSNATVNFTLTAEPTNVSITKEVNTSISLIIAVNIPETQTTTLGVTFLQEDLPTRFDIESITLTVPNASATSSFLPSPSLPFSSTPPAAVASSTASPIPNSNSTARNDTGTVVGAALGGVLGTLLFVATFLLVYRYYRRLRRYH